MTTAQRVIKYCAVAFAVFLIVSIIGGLVGAAASLPALCGAGDAVGEMRTHTVAGTVENLEVDLGGTRLEIKTGGHFSVESDHRYLKVENTDGTLSIKEEHPAAGFYSEGAQVILTVPENFTFQQAAISAGAGAVKADAIRAERLTLDLGAGEVDIGNLTATAKATINSGAGELKAGGGELADLDLDIGVGEVDLESRLTGDCRLDYGVGELDLTLAGTREDYRIALDKGVGKATFDGAKVSGDAVYGDGAASIEIDGGVGELNIRFAL